MGARWSSDVSAKLLSTYLVCVTWFEHVEGWKGWGALVSPGSSWE